MTSAHCRAHDVILFFYSCAGGSTLPSQGKPFTQNLAYSTDGGKTLIRCEKPILDEIVFANRDPKVIYYEPDDCYIMVLYLEKHDFAFFRSKNLLDWEEIQRFTFSEYSECPDFYPLPVEGENAVKWVFSAAADGYYLGSFDGKNSFRKAERCA